MLWNISVYLKTIFSYKIYHNLVETESLNPSIFLKSGVFLIDIRDKEDPMSQFEYTPDDDVRIHEAGTIKLLCTAFLSHESGLPEWLKNSADAYAREDASEQKRVIVIIFNFGRKSLRPSISCLDFSGMTSNTIIDHFRNWASPDAALQGAKTSAVQGGHGNGGKCYMTHMFEDYSQLYTVKQSKGNIYGVKGGSIRFGFIPNPNDGRDFSVPNIRHEIEKVLSTLGCPLHNFSNESLEALELADGFTLVTGVGPRGYGNKIPYRQLIVNLKDHTQMIQTLNSCKVFVVVNGEPFDRGKRLTLPRISPMKGAEEPRIIQVPDVLEDPISGEQISTTNGNVMPQGSLILRTSDKSMRWSMKGRHNIIYKTGSGYIGYIGVPELDIQSPYRDRIYGECYLEALEPLKQNERARLANSPLTWALERFISEQINAYAKEFEARDRRRIDKEEKNFVSIMNEALDQWKNRFLNEILHGMWSKNGGEGGAGDEGRRILPIGKPTRIELSLSHQKAGVGVSLRPTLKFFDINGSRIRTVPYRWLSEDDNVAMVNDDLMIVETFAVGQTLIYAETLDGTIKSNKIPLEVVKIHEIKIHPQEIQLLAGSRQKLEAICKLANKDETSDIYLVWTEDNPNIARVSASGLVFGFEPGETQVTAGDDRCEATEPAVIIVLPIKDRGKGDQRGRGFPTVKISEVDTDPYTGEQRVFSSEIPPVWQEPKDVERNIWWINSAAPLARMYSDTRLDYGYNSREWRMYHLERYIDIMVQIALTHGPTERESISVGDWILKWGEQVSEIQAAAASSLSEFIATGRLFGE
jgi:hypothetical protein